MTERMRCLQCVGEARDVCEAVFAKTVETETTNAVMAQIGTTATEALDANSAAIQNGRKLTYGILEALDCLLTQEQIDNNIMVLKG